MKNIILVAFLLFNISCFSQDLIEINKSKDSENSRNLEVQTLKGKEYQIFSNYKVFDFLKEYMKLEEKNIDARLKTISSTVDVKIVSLEQVNSDEILSKIQESIKNIFRINIKSITEEVVLCYAEKNTNENLEHCIKKDGEISLETLGGKYWKGKCVTMQDLIRQVEEWYAISIFSKIKDTTTYNFEMEYFDDFEVFCSELDKKYKIKITQEKTLVNKIIVE
ncbi:hypothetical protein [Aureivirga sp. CE67]|uniref:hypothetical protein n=1 Tax=Aureivirga sp. CE67 TaxID=1788983 RepID=UPI0018CBB61B|nr:hypothetical protein [Aureivirga sp. CE67]